MKPIPESREAVDEYGPFVDRDLLGDLEDRSDRVREIVPGCVGLSLSVLSQDVVVTLVADDGGCEIRSSLTLPIHRDGQVVASIDLYAVSPAAFDDHHDTLAKIFHARALGAVTDADLAFSTLAEARLAPVTQRAAVSLNRASALLGGTLGIDHEAARQRLGDSARRAGVPLDLLAGLVIEVLSGP